MIERTVTLIYLNSHFIINYIDRHPICWPSEKLAKRGGSGDRAGIPPTSMVYEFFSLLSQKQGLYTQREYRDHCFEQWKGWKSLDDEKSRAGVSAKLFRNVYPAMINTLHAWALLVEAGWFSICVVDTFTDAFSKHDLIVYRGADRCNPIALDLFIDTKASRSDRAYKQSHRKATRDFVGDFFEIPLKTADRPKKMPGNMRWYCLRDFESVYTKIRNRDSIWDTPVVLCTCGYHLKGRASA